MLNSTDPSAQNLRFITNVATLNDVRVFIIPNAYPGKNGENVLPNTLAHYIAMNDDIYCNLIYHQFALNPLLKDAPDRL